ncbi:MAG: RNA-binding protein [Gammaproteobacteria bacterium]
MTPAYKHHFSTKMVVRNLAPDTTVEKLNFMFAEYGAVHSVKLRTDVMTGRCGGVAYVTVDEQVTGSAQNALDGSHQEGRVIRVSIEQKSGRTAGRRNPKAAS